MDIKTLTQESSPEIRGMLAGKIAMEYSDNHFSASEASIAADIFRVLVKDVEIQIRKTIAERLADCPHVPHDIILKLAGDDPEVSLNVLERSPVLTEDDLIAIVRSTHEVVKLCAIARRHSISEDLSGSLLETANTLVWQNLLKNKGAALNERQLMKSWEKILSNSSLLETLVDRGGLPLTIAEKLYLAVSDELKESLKIQYKSFSPHLHSAVDDAYEWKLLGLSQSDECGDLWDDGRVGDLVRELYGKDRLTHSLLMRALCIGNLKIFETGIAKLAHIPRVNARILLLESSGLGFEAIYQAAKMPEGFYEAIKVLLRISLEETEFGEIRRNDFRKRIIDRIYIGKHHRTVENMEYLLAIIGGKSVVGSNLH